MPVRITDEPFPLDNCPVQHAPVQQVFNVLRSMVEGETDAHPFPPFTYGSIGASTRAGVGPGEGEVSIVDHIVLPLLLRNFPLL